VSAREWSRHGALECRMVGGYGLELLSEREKRDLIAFLQSW
jgi:hypothetical protein